MRTFILVAALVATPLAFVACSGGPDMASLSKMNPTELMSGYTSKLGDLGGLLKGVNSTESAAKALPKAQDLVSNLGGYAEQIKLLPPGQVDSLLKQYGSQLDPAMKVVDEQIARLAQNPTYGSALSSALGKLPRLN